MSWSELIYMGREYERLNSQKESLETENKELKDAIKWLAEKYEEETGIVISLLCFEDSCPVITKVLREEKS
jgi:hypothetical protein